MNIVDIIKLILLMIIVMQMMLMILIIIMASKFKRHRIKNIEPFDVSNILSPKEERELRK